MSGRRRWRQRVAWGMWRLPLCALWGAPCLAGLAQGGQAGRVAGAEVAEAAAAGPEAPLLLQLEGLDRRLSVLEHAVQVAEANRRQAEATLAAAQATTATAALRYAACREKFSLRLRAAMRSHQGAVWAHLGGSHSVADLLRRQRMLDAVAAHDKRLWQALQRAKADYDGAVAFADETYGKLMAAEAARRAQRDQVAARRRWRKERLVALAKSRAAKATLGTEQQQSQQLLGGVLADGPPAAVPARSGFAAKRGQLPWPAEGRVKAGFGQRVELTFGTATAHNGLDIAAPAGATVRAVADGKVVYADWLRGFGQVVIVDHAAGYHSVMAHLSVTQVARNQKVRAGQVLGLVGDTGSLRGTVLYFELRRDGLPQDPRPWLVASN